MIQRKLPTSKAFLFAFLLVTLSFTTPLFSQAQQKTVTGTVTDESGTPLSNISVVVQNSTTGTTTNEKGKYSINVVVGATLVFSSVNHETYSLVVGEGNQYNVNLKQKAGTMSDVVVVGYGKQKKVNLVGAVGTVNVDEKMTSRPVQNVSEGLSGMVPGLSAVSNSGMAGNNGATLLIRGMGTVNNASPLIVVDGMPDVDINRVNMNDIESISVLKDATSASVYGSRAANGVILITTKSGKGLKKTAINFSSVTAVTVPTKGFQFMADYPRALTLEQRRSLTGTLPSNLIFKNGTIDQWMAMGMIDPLRYPNTDWWNIIMQNGSYRNFNVSATGGDEKSNFYASLGLRDENGLQINNTYKQYNARFNYDFKLRSNMNTGFKFNGNWSNYLYSLAEGFTDPSSTNTAGFDMQYAIAGILPYDPTTGYFGGVMAYGEDPQAYNPYTQYVNNQNHQERQEANTYAYFDWTPIKGLTGGVDYALNYYNEFDWNAPMPNQAYNFQTQSFGSRVYVGPNAGISNNTYTGYKTLLNARLNYHTVLASHHDIAALFVYSEEYWHDRFQGSARNDRIYPTLHEIDAALNGIQTTGGNSSSEGLRSYIGRVNYTAYNKYLLEGDFRVDGSSKFNPGHQYGFFPSVAVGWRFTEEDFINRFTSRFLSSGKLRASYGSLGNNSGVGKYEQQVTLTTNNYIINNTVTSGFVNSKMVNQFLTWETTSVLNIGLDLGFIHNKLTTEIDYYNRLTTGMNRPSDQSILLAGAYTPPPRSNIGNMRNQGIELNVNWKDRIGNISYGFNVNGSYNTTQIEKWNEFLARGATSSGNNVFLNMPYNFVYSYVDKGIAQTWQDVYNATPQGAQPGDVLRKDINGDGRIDDNDRVAYTNVTRDRPSTYYAFNGYVSWKGFDLSLLFQGSAGRKDYWINAFNNLNFSTQRYASTWEHWNNPWSLDNRSGLWPRLGGSGNNQALTSFWLDDMSFLRFKNLQLAYSIPKSILKRASVSNLRIAGSIENLATFTSYRGLDPEKAGNNNNLYPINKSYSLSVQLGF